MITALTPCARERVLVQFEIPPKAFAKFQPGGGACDNPGTHATKEFNAVSVGQTASANAFSVGALFFGKNPGLKQRWAEICERLRRIFKLNQYA
jgi:hypothetical protein